MAVQAIHQNEDLYDQVQKANELLKRHTSLTSLDQAAPEGRSEGGPTRQSTTRTMRPVRDYYTTDRRWAQEKMSDFGAGGTSPSAPKFFV